VVLLKRLNGGDVSTISHFVEAAFPVPFAFKDTSLFCFGGDILKITFSSHVAICSVTLPEV